jgi:vacuolar protein sorting-associated protein 45
MTLISASKTPNSNKLRLAILYALRYQKLVGNQISQVVDQLIHSGVSADRARLVYVMLNFAGADVRQDDLFMNENFFSRGKTALKGLKVGHSSVVLLSVGLMTAGRGECVYSAYTTSFSDA